MSNSIEIQVTDEQELVVRAKQGCAEALETLVRKYHLPLRAFLVQRTGDMSIADDLAQDVFLTAMRRISTVDDATSFRSWLFTVARNKAVDHLRTMIRQKTKQTESLEAILAVEYSRRSDHDMAAADEGLLASMRECVAKLDPRARNLIDLFYYQNLSAVQIAESRNQKSNSVRMALMRIRKVLARCIRRKMEGEIES